MPGGLPLESYFVPKAWQLDKTVDLTRTTPRACVRGMPQPPRYWSSRARVGNHPDTVAVFLVDQTAKFTYPDGKSEEAAAKAGQTMWEKAGAHLPENVGKGPIDLILVELKGKLAEKE